MQKLYFQKKKKKEPKTPKPNYKQNQNAEI